MFAEREELVLAAMSELSERILELRTENYRLRNEVDRLRRFEYAVDAATQISRDVRSVLAAVTWADDLEEAQDIAVQALRGENIHIESPPDSSDDNSSISDP